MKFITSILTEDMAKEIFKWKYSGEYSVYNLPKWNVAKRLKFGLTDKEKREKEFVALVDKEYNICGYFRLREEDGEITIGVGLRPILCGQGLGKELMEYAKKECNKRYGYKKIRLEVRSFNRRAIKCYESVGFKVKKVHIRKTKVDNSEFLIMEYEK